MTDGTAVVPGPLKLDLADAPGTPIKHASRGRYKPRAQPVKPADLIVQERFADFGREATISQDELSSFKYISKGGFATVYRAQLRSASTGGYSTVAVKVLRPVHLLRPMHLRRFLQEVAVQHAVCHPNVVKVLGCCMLPLARLKDATPPKVFERMTEKRASAAAEQQQQQQPAAGGAAGQQGGAAGAQQGGRRGGDVGADQQGESDLCWALVQEYLEEGTLYSMVALQWQNPQLALYSSEAALGWMLGLARAVQHLHAASPQVIHRDLKLENILLTRARGGGAGVVGAAGPAGPGSQLVAKLADFGLVVAVDTKGTKLPLPELINNPTINRQLSAKVDQALGTWRRQSNSARQSNSQSLTLSSQGSMGLDLLGVLGHHRGPGGFSGSTFGGSRRASAVAVAADGGCGIVVAAEVAAGSVKQQQQQRPSHLAQHSGVVVHVEAAGCVDSSEGSGGRYSSCSEGGGSEPPSPHGAGGPQYALAAAQLAVAAQRRQQLLQDSALLGLSHSPQPHQASKSWAHVPGVLCPPLGRPLRSHAISSISSMSSSSAAAPPAADSRGKPAPAAVAKEAAATGAAGADVQPEQEQQEQSKAEGAAAGSTASAATAAAAAASQAPASGSSSSGSQAQQQAATDTPEFPKTPSATPSSPPAAPSTPTASAPPPAAAPALALRQRRVSSVSSDQHQQVRLACGAKKAPLLLPSLPGTPRLADNRYNLTGRCGSLLYMAPEVARDQPYNETVDVFGFGVLLYEVFARDLVAASYVADNTMQGYIKYAQRVAWLGFRPTIPQHLPRALQELIAACWSQDPLKRPSFCTIIAQLEELRPELQALDRRQQRQAGASGLPLSTMAVAPGAGGAARCSRGGKGGAGMGAVVEGGCGGVMGLGALGLGMEGCLPLLFEALLPGRMLGRV